MKFCTQLLVGLLIFVGTPRCLAQMPLADTLASKNTRPVSQPAYHLQDVADLVKRWYPRLHITPHDSSTLQEGKRFVLVIPQVGYTLQTRALVAVLVNTPFRMPGANMSSMSGQLSYTQNNQIILTTNSMIWSRDNRFLWTSDWRLMHYPQATYGLGMYTSTDTRVVDMDYSYFRFYQSFLKRLAVNFYGGIGYYLDLHWNIDSYNNVREFTRISRYSAGVQGRSVSSGPAIHLLYDNRQNAINPTGGLYINAVFRANMSVLGSDDTYQSLLLEARKYLHLSPTTDNVLALWSYNAFTLDGDPPFLDLPSTGWDNTGNVGRGFIQGRFRGKNFLYGEAEYRFHITNDRLLGGVVFANAQTVTELGSGKFEKVLPALGGGLRIKMNKISRTNLSVDYGFGMDGSHGLFFNLGEVF
ncbi:BamA/TamA family outer membrane protein [Spirosoma sp. KCTC 42546]|uniref:BamA/TamA family outer membrane protein n=1 Tax=Spirosoma sp. KCTC 42546 TaxID=2520506 RepID=UPI00115AE81E|nr:BamA/TamA family outer membrane protein [Spirosoma sp. KCTC 42546]QDK80353.1 BamA/TamA family outer membrane protein [Spirosoma sp. KCTC 42546]